MPNPTNLFRDYSVAYVRRFNALRKQTTAGPEMDRLYLRPLQVVKGILAGEGVLLLAYPRGVPRGTDNRVRLLNRRSETISQVAQSVTANLIKVPRHPLGTIPEDLEQDLIETGDLNPEMFSERLPDILSLSGVAVSPLIRFSGKARPRLLESRFHLWSPIFRLPSGKTVRQFAWTFADFLWMPLEKLSDDFGRSSAEEDLNLLRLATESGHTAQHIAENPYNTIAGQLFSACEHFERLIDDPSTTERAVQTFLAQDRHHFLVAPIARRVWSHRPLAGLTRNPDFTVQQLDGEYEFVEIKDPNRPIFQGKGERPAEALVEALTQVEDALRYVDENRQTVEREDGFEGIHRPRGRVVVGREQHLGQKARKRLRFQKGEQGRIRRQTYDDLLAEARAYADSLQRRGAAEWRNVGRSPDRSSHT